MKLTKKLETEVRQAYHTFWKSLLSVDMKTFSALLDDDFRQIGTTEAETFFNKKAVTRYTKAAEEQIAGNIELRNQKIKIESLDQYILITDLCDCYVKIDNKWTFYSRCRSSFLLHHTKAGWKFIQQHTSMPDHRTEEGETIALKRIAKENLELRDAIKRRTIELENKNRELEIEAALEKVRSIALGMKEPANMPEVCKNITLQLQSLGVKEIRNVQTAIFYESKGTYMNYEYYAKHKKTFITETVYTNHKVAKDFAKKMLQGKGEIYITHIKGEKVKEWLAYQKTTNVFIDKYLNTASSLNYYWHSLGPVALGISTYSPLNKEELGLFKRFLNVFELAYTRYLDIEQAIAQARKAKIEASLERVRAVAMSMMKPHELLKVCSSVFTELRLLDFTQTDLRNAQIIINNDDKGIYSAYQYSDYIGGEIAEVPYDLHPMIRLLNDKLRLSKDTFADIEISGAALEDWKGFVNNFPQKHDEKLNATTELHYYFYSVGIGALGISSFKSLPEEKLEILQRLRNVFNLSYQRYTDIALAEAQAREAQIELGLERVRARAMAMQHSVELAELVATVFRELNQLDFSLASCIIWIHDPSHKSNALWIASDKMNKPARPLQVRPFYPDFFTSIIAAWKVNDPKWIFSLTGAEKKKFEKLFFKEYPELPEALKKPVRDNKQIVFSASFNNFGALEVVATEPLSDEKFEILHRFGKVFNASYTRFNDLKKAEAQAKESQIQLALERVRARTMAMQKSEELPEAANLLFQQLQALGMPAWSAGYCIWNEDKSAVTLWMSSEGVLQPPFNAPTTEDELFIQMRKGHEKSKPLHVVEMGGNKLTAHYQYMRTLPVVGDVLDSIIEAGHPLPAFQVMHYAYFSKGYLLFITYEPVPDAHDIFKRFAAVFDQTYTRFLDLQNAEAQARESQIQLALERVRARTMAMQKSDELPETSHILFEQMKELGEPVEQLSIGIVHEENNVIEISATLLGDTLKKIYSHSIDEPYMMAKVYKAWKKQQKTVVVELRGDELNAYNQYRNELTNSKMFPTNLGKEHQRIVYAAFFSKGMLALGANETRPPESLELLLKFASVFDLTYTRFLDLQKAEAQSREAQIEVAVERVRSKALAMHKSDEILGVVATLRNELAALKIPGVGAATIYLQQENGDVRLWDITLMKEQEEGIHFSMNFNFRVEEADSNLWIRKIWDSDENYVVIEQDEQDLRRAIEWTRKYNIETAEMTQQFLEANQIVRSWHPTVKLANGKLTTDFILPPQAEVEFILVKMGAAFDLAYKRFLDLQKAEAQTREAQIETALERVRSRSLAMHKSEELSELVAVLYEKMNELGVLSDGININVIKEGAKDFESWLAAPGQSYAVCFHVPYFNHPVIVEIIEAIKTQKELLTKVYSFEEKTSFFSYLYNNTDFRYLPEDRKKLVLESKNWEVSIAFAKNTALSLHSYSGKIFSNDENEILKRFAKVFEQSYTRFLDLQKAETHAEIARLNLIQIQEEKQRAEDALTELQATQKQLIQSEKMASLGELTAGIAHEIQNPLNFVNNFSEVSNELLDEMMEEVAKGNYAEVKAIADDVKQNLEKINHHGKRADGIVKSMLQHSRSSSATKEPTDINKLADEYLRLAYHGLRAKDKSFNATMKTDFDETIGNINIIPQDIGRVILNLITNAFYEVDKKKKHGSALRQALGDSYEPTVSVSTKKENGNVMIRVKDNADGIPQKVLDKIFQPFFTTKPTGQGTGLGLSLSYDIVKAHGGEIKVTTKENEGTEFTITLPA